MMGTATARSAFALSGDLPSIDVRTALMAPLTRVRIDLFRRFLFVFCLARLMADLCVANVLSSFLEGVKSKIYWDIFFLSSQK